MPPPAVPLPAVDARPKYSALTRQLLALDDEAFAGITPVELDVVLVPVRVRFRPVAATAPAS